MENQNSFELVTPVAFIIFNRPDTTLEVIKKIREAKPSKLYIIADAARPNKEGEAEKVAETRRVVEEAIDWDCEIHKNYAKENMGCKMRVSSGISWVFEHEDRAIIIEDDIIPSMDFFRFEQDMLEYYKDNPKVMMVSGVNLVREHSIKTQYTFSCFAGIWGWGTWARAWNKYDADVKEWPKVDKEGRFKCVAPGLAYVFLKKNMDSVYNHTKDTWDIQWDFCRHYYKGLGIVPKVNMINNIGFEREDATHTNSKSYEDFSYGEMTFPIEFTDNVRRDPEYDKAYIKKYFGLRKIFMVIKKKLRLV